MTRSTDDDAGAAPFKCCHICGRQLNVNADPLSRDCGGDCWGCIGLIEAKMGGGPADNASIGFVAREIAWGWREGDGSPKPQAVFLADPALGQRKDALEDQALREAILAELSSLERDQEIVVCSPNGQLVTTRLYDAIADLIPHTGLNREEMMGVRSLILNAIADKRFFDWEMPTLTGFSAEEFAKIAEKLPKV